MLRPFVAAVQALAHGHHGYDLNLALGNLVTDLAAAESTWLHR
jgi:hypothetical protein